MTITIFDNIIKITNNDNRYRGVGHMPREKFHTLTEPMFYILLCLKEECCGMDIMSKVDHMTGGRVNVGPGTLYNLLEQFLSAEMIYETKVVGRRRSYILSRKGKQMLADEYHRMEQVMADYRSCMDNMASEES